MKTTDIDFSPLKTYSALFMVYRWVKRIQLIVVRLALISALVYFVYFITKQKGMNINVSGSYSMQFDIVWVIAVWFILFVALMASMNAPWMKFAKKNNFRCLSPNLPRQPTDRVTSLGVPAQMTIPSFKGKLSRTSLYPIVGNLGDVSFGFFTRFYKEGGVLRYRERQMDTIIWIDLPKTLPVIVIDATANEKARLSNKSKHFESSWKFQFEGSHGAHYDVYADPKDRITALQLFTPDVLNVLYSRLPDVDIEINGDTMWFIKRYGVLNEKLAAEMFAAVEALLPELFKQVKAALLQ